MNQNDVRKLMLECEIHDLKHDSNTLLAKIEDRKNQLRTLIRNMDE